MNIWWDDMVTSITSHIRCVCGCIMNASLSLTCHRQNLHDHTWLHNCMTLHDPTWPYVTYIPLSRHRQNLHYYTWLYISTWLWMTLHNLYTFIISPPNIHALHKCNDATSSLTPLSNGYPVVRHQLWIMEVDMRSSWMIAVVTVL